MKDVAMHMMVVFIVIITWSIYVLWGQHDDFCFYIILGLLAVVLYFIAKTPTPFSVEAFAQQQNGGKNGSGGESSIPINIAAYAKLAKLHTDTASILRPRLENLVAAFRGDAKIEEAQKYDEDGNTVDERKPDEVPIDKGKEGEIRVMNFVLRDMRRFDPGYYYALLALANGKDTKVVEEEYVI